MTLSFVQPTALPWPELDKKICESLGCNNRAVIEVKVSAGKYGIINLNLCIKCVPMFKNKLTASQQQLTVDRMVDPNGISLSTT